MLRRAGAIVVAVALGLGLVGCSARTANESAGALPPVISETYDLEGARFEINAEQPLVINVSDPTEWKGHVEDPSVAEFVPGPTMGWLSTIRVSRPWALAAQKRNSLHQMARRTSSR